MAALDQPEINIEIGGEHASQQETEPPHTASLDRRPQSPPGQGQVMRSHTLRTDYADRMRERVKSLRTPLRGSEERFGTMQARPKPHTKTETYVRSDTIKIPKWNFSLKRKKNQSKHVVSTPNEPVVRRPQPSITAKTVQALQHSRAPPPSMPRLGGSFSGGSHGALFSEPSHYQSTGGSQYASNRQLTSICANESEYAKVPYVSREISDGDVVGDDHTAQLMEALRKTQPFLRTWPESIETNDTPEKRADANECIRKYINTCARLRAADLQGQFAAFQYPLPTFDLNRWRLRARFGDWDDMELLNAPEEKTEYVRLPRIRVPFCGVGQKQSVNKIIYCAQTVDSLLSEWLEHRDPNDSSQDTYVNLRRCQPPSSEVFHPALLVATLKQLSKADSVYDLSTKNELFQACLQLAILLTYECCFCPVAGSKCISEASDKPLIKPQDVLIILSASNCLVLFRPEAKKPSASGDAEVENDGTEGVEEKKTDEAIEGEFVSSVCPEFKSVEEGIKGLIEKIHTMATERLSVLTMVPTLLNAIAPPDWMAMVISRIVVKHST